MKRFLFFLYVVCLSLEINAQKLEQYYMPKETSVEAFQKYVGENVVYAGNPQDLQSKDALAMIRGEIYRIEEVGETTKGIVSFALTRQKDKSYIVQHVSFSKRTALEYGVLYIDDLILIRSKSLNDATADIRNKEYNASRFHFKVKEFSYLTKTPESPNFTLYATFEDVDSKETFFSELKDFDEASINTAFLQVKIEYLENKITENTHLEKPDNEGDKQKVREEKNAKSPEDEVVDLDFPIVASGMPHKVFVEIIAYAKPLSTKVTINVDFGQVQKLFGSNDFLVDKQTGKKIVFNSLVDAMNYFGRLGWDFEQAYVVTTINKKLGGLGGEQNVYHWLLSKTVLNDNEITQGLAIKRDLKK